MRLSRSWSSERTTGRERSRPTPMFPDLVINSPYYMGDNVSIEPAADALAQSLGKCTYIQSVYAALFENHPNIFATDGRTKLTTTARYIDVPALAKVSVNKVAEAVAEVGMPDAYVRQPRLYLSAKEKIVAQSHKALFSEPCVGVVYGSRALGKNWCHVDNLIKYLIPKYNVFIFGDAALDLPKSYEKQVYKVAGKPERELMTYLSMMDVLIGCDTGPTHIALSLGVPCVVVAFDHAACNYDSYENCAVLTAPYGTREGIKSVSPLQVLKQTEQFLVSNNHSEPADMAFCRIRGIGDVLMSLPGIATLRSLDGESTYTYITSPGMANVLEQCTDVIDKVVGIGYNHATSGFPVLPSGVDWDGYDVVHNLINRVEFNGVSSEVPRTELFGKLMGVDEIDYDQDWKLHIPEAWTNRAWEILGEYGLCKDSRIIALQVASEGLSRIWPKERWMEFVGMADNNHYDVVLLSDQEIGRQPRAAINLCGKLSLEEFFGIAAVATIGVTPDSALMHIMGCLDKPCIALFGAIEPALRISHYNSIYPLRHRMRCMPCNDWQFRSCSHKKRSPECMWKIMPKDVMSAVHYVVDTGRRRSRVLGKWMLRG